MSIPVPAGGKENQSLSIYLKGCYSGDFFEKKKTKL